MAITLQSLAREVSRLTKLQSLSDDLSIVIEPSYSYVGHEQVWQFTPQIKSIPGVTTLAAMCEAINWYIPLNGSDTVTKLGDVVTRSEGSLESVHARQTKMPASPVKYVCPANEYNGNPATFAAIYAAVITSAPTEITSGGRTFRVLKGSMPYVLAQYTNSRAGTAPSEREAMFALSTDSPAYNYLDRGHVIFFILPKNGHEPFYFITNQVSLQVYYAALALAANPNTAATALRHGVFLPATAGPEMTRTLQTLERSIPVKMATAYNTIKQAIRANFEANAQNLIVTKFQRSEIREVKLNSIAFQKDRISYETISLEAPDIGPALLSSLDPNAQFDIYNVVETHINNVLGEISAMPTSGSGFQTAREWQFAVNGIPITVSVATTNTRRKINGHYINAEELVRVLRRATCYNNAVMYDKFLRQVERASLRVHDACSNGFPIKIFVLDRHYDYNRPATDKHPKIFFCVEEGKYKIIMDKARTIRVPLKRFVGLLDALRGLNSKTNNGYNDDNDGLVGGPYQRRNADWCAAKLQQIIKKHAVDDAGTVLVTDAQLKVLVDFLLEARSECEKKSKELLDAVVKDTKAVPVAYNGVDAYEITGRSGRVYVVEKANFKVWDKATNGYVCIVDGRGEMGVGYDGLVARLLALKNDGLVVDRITTLRGHVAQGAAPIPEPAIPVPVELPAAN